LNNFHIVTARRAVQQLHTTASDLHWWKSLRHAEVAWGTDAERQLDRTVIPRAPVVEDIV